MKLRSIQRENLALDFFLSRLDQIKISQLLWGSGIINLYLVVEFEILLNLIRNRIPRAKNRIRV